MFARYANEDHSMTPITICFSSLQNSMRSPCFRGSPTKARNCSSKSTSTAETGSAFSFRISSCSTSRMSFAASSCVTMPVRMKAISSGLNLAPLRYSNLIRLFASSHRNSSIAVCNTRASATCARAAVQTAVLASSMGTCPSDSRIARTLHVLPFISGPSPVTQSTVIWIRACASCQEGGFMGSRGKKVPVRIAAPTSCC
mmetsp:Transcript_65417/g.128948  ORF Transcript_65417/g.128948 Transcript_65417/m.128948 type:complete len:200 (-) Transcript_65417:697-1296(-)